MTLSGEVAESVGSLGFVLAGPRSGESVLVVSATPPDAPVDSVLKVIGMAEEFDLLEVEEELDTDLEDDLFDPFEEETVVIARAVDQ